MPEVVGLVDDDQVVVRKGRVVGLGQERAEPVRVAVRWQLRTSTQGTTDLSRSVIKARLPLPSALKLVVRAMRSRRGSVTASCTRSESRSGSSTGCTGPPEAARTRRSVTSQLRLTKDRQSLAHLCWMLRLGARTSTRNPGSKWRKSASVVSAT